MIVPPVIDDLPIRQWQVTADHAHDGAFDGSVPMDPTKIRSARAPGGREYTVRTYVDGWGDELA